VFGGPSGLTAAAAPRGDKESPGISLAGRTGTPPVPRQGSGHLPIAALKKQ
jgi:hypothetical protein